VLRLFGVVMLTLCPAGSTQPVAASGVAGLGAAATQIVCDILLTNVTRRREPAAPEGGGSEAAGAEEAEEAEEVEEDGLAEGILASVGVADRPLGEGVAVITAGWVAAVPVAAFALAAGALAEAAPAPSVPRAAQPAVSRMALSSAAVVSRPVNGVRRRPPFRPNMPNMPNITSVLPACLWLRTGDARRRRRITHFVFRIFRYPGLWVVSPRL
jgi:hypothetical protein